jgi:hypothetical protein
MSVADLRSFEARLRSLTVHDGELRPFICDGSPLACQAFVVGLNPATSLPFWDFWDANVGFKKGDWFAAYRAARTGRRFPVSPTRRNIELVIEAALPVNCLETDIYAKPTRALRDLAVLHRSAQVFDFLLATLRPKAMLVYGKEAVQHVQSLANQELQPNTLTLASFAFGKVAVVAGSHLYNWRPEKAREVGRILRQACEDPATEGV